MRHGKVQNRYFVSMWHSRILILFTSLILVIGITLSTLWYRDYRSVKSNVETLIATFVPDKRMDVADIQIRPGILSIHLDGETSHPELFNHLLSDSLTTLISILNDVVMLPDTSVIGRETGVVKVAVANMRREPRHGAELVDQAILGTELRILKQRRGWYYVKTSWEYLGWITGSSIHFTAHPLTPTHRVSAQSVQVRESADTSSLILVDAPFGATLTKTADIGRFSRVILPDSTTGYVPTSTLASLPRPAPSSAPDAPRLVATANLFHGIPYLWGGNSTSGFDCSGFTQTVFREQGIILPRDANMQIRLGEDVPYTDGDFSQVLAGDLLYFGPNPDRITHVALSLGGAKIIHASEFVMMNSLDENDPDYAPDRRRTLQAIRRIH